MQGIFQKENTDKVLKYGIYRHLPTYEKIIRNLVSFYYNKFKLNKIDKLPDSVSIDKHIQELLIYWHLIVNNSTIETENIDKIFYNTISSLKGESNTAIIALYLIKRKDSNNI